MTGRSPLHVRSAVLPLVEAGSAFRKTIRRSLALGPSTFRLTGLSGRRLRSCQTRTIPEMAPYKPLPAAVLLIPTRAVPASRHVKEHGHARPRSEGITEVVRHLDLRWLSVATSALLNLIHRLQSARFTGVVSHHLLRDRRLGRLLPRLAVPRHARRHPLQERA